MKRPIGVTVIAVVAILGGLWQILLALTYLGLTVPMFAVASGVRALIFPIGAGSLLFGALALVFGFAALRLRPWAWTLGVLLYALDLIAALAVLFAGGPVAVTAVVAVLSAAVIGYLYTNGVRLAFGHEHGHQAATGTHGPSPA